MDSTIYGEKGLYVHSTAPSFNAIVTGIKPFIFHENGYEFSFTGLQMQLCRTGLGLLVGGDLHLFILKNRKATGNENRGTLLGKNEWRMQKKKGKGEIKAK